jgi:cold shock CspA family protein
MRVTGTLQRWNDDKGFGFIKPDQGTQDIFVHISAFPKGSIRPTAGETLSFEVEVCNDGKKRAVSVQRPGLPSHKKITAKTPRPSRPERNSAKKLLALVLVASVGGWGITQFRQPATSTESQSNSTPATQTKPRPRPTEQYRCDGRTHCSQMTSCDEAKFFLRSCIGVEMDGDNDGIPCEQQLCGGGWGR